MIRHFCDLCKFELTGNTYYTISGNVEKHPGIQGSCILTTMVHMELCDICMRAPRSMKDCLAPDPDVSKWKVSE